jgi:hypothetical protein
MVRFGDALGVGAVSTIEDGNDPHQMRAPNSPSHHFTISRLTTRVREDHGT